MAGPVGLVVFGFGPGPMGMGAAVYASHHPEAAHLDRYTAATLGAGSAGSLPLCSSFGR